MVIVYIYRVDDKYSVHCIYIYRVDDKYSVLMEGILIDGGYTELMVGILSCW